MDLKNHFWNSCPRFLDVFQDAHQGEKVAGAFLAPFCDFFVCLFVLRKFAAFQFEFQ